MLRGTIAFSLNNKLAVWILTVIVTVAGLYSGFVMKQETLPDLEIPVLTVTSVYPGAAPEEVAEQVTRPLEQRLQNLDGVLTVQSSSMESVASLIVEYDYGKDMDSALAEAREAVAGVGLPSGAGEPGLSRISLNAFPVLSLSLTDDVRTLEELTLLIEDEIQPALEGLPGVADVQVAGQYVQEVQLTFDAAKMQSLGLTEETVKGIIQGSALKAPLGLFAFGDSEQSVVVDGNIVTLDDLKQLALPITPAPSGLFAGAGAPGTGAVTGTGAGSGSAEGGTPGAATAVTAMPTVPLEDIADIRLVGRAESISRTNGAESVGIQIVKAPEANTVEVVNLVKDEMSALAEREPGLQVSYMLDQGEPIEHSVATMLNKALFGAIFAVIVILLFLRNIRTTIISIISIPLSLLIAILLLRQMDITLNMMTLGAMTVAIGRVVDDSIVVIENIFRRMSLSSEPLKGKALVLSATREMFIPIMSSTIVTIAVFLPLALVGGMVGELFLPFALTIVFSLLASLLVAVTVVPMLGHALFRKGVGGKNLHREDQPGKLAAAYKRALRWALDHKAWSMAAAVLLFVASLFLVPVIGASFLPEEEQKYAMVTYTPAAGELLEDVEQAALRAEQFILAEPDVTSLQYSVGGSNPFSPGPSRSALFYILYDDEVERFEEVKTRLLEQLRQTVPAAGAWNSIDFSAGAVGGSNLSLLVYGESMEQIIPVVEQLRESIAAEDDFRKVETSVGETYGQYTLVADQKKLMSYGLTAGQVVMALGPQRAQPPLTQVEADGKTYEVKVQTEQQTYNSIEDMRDRTIASPFGISVPLRDVVEVREGESPNTISMRDGRVYAEITAEITARDVAGASTALENKIAAMNLPSSVDVEFGGVTEQINETFTQLGLAMAAAIAIVYLVLVITFGRALAPFTIMFSLPFAVIGALVALWIAGETISVSAMMGALMLIGIVVTNAIVLIDRVIHKEHDGMSVREALLEAGVTRLRPILMTALATIGALLPLAFGFESAGLISKGLGVTVIGGLTSSTLLTLVVVPIVYEWLMKFRRKQAEERI